MLRFQDVKMQLAGLQKWVNAIGKVAALKNRTDALMETPSAIADELFNPEIRTSQDSLNYLPKLDFQLSGVGGMSAGADVRTTAAALARHTDPQEQLEAVLRRLDSALTQELSALSKIVADAGNSPLIAARGEQKRE